MEINKQDLRQANILLFVMGMAFIITEGILLAGYQIGFFEEYETDGRCALIGVGMLLGAFYYYILLESIIKNREHKEYVERLEQENAELKGKNND